MRYIFIAGLACFVALYAVFTITQGAYPETAELAFIEHSFTQLGSVIPASCESDPNTANGDGNYSGCATIVCWNGSTITPAAGQSCPPNLPPVANAGGDVTQDVSIGVAIPSWSASASDPENLPITISWTNIARPGGAAALSAFGNNPQSIPSGTSLPVATFWLLDTPGTYTFQMSVTDSVGQTVTDTMNVNVIASSTQFDLTVIKNGTGDGTVTSNPGGINCGGSCSATYSDGTLVNLSAVALSGSAFAGWSGGGCSGPGACAVSMTSAKNVTATFNVGAGPSCSNPPCGGPGGGSSSGSFTCVGVPANASVYSGDDTGLSQTFVAIHRLNTSAKCEFSCNSGFIWNGSSCVDALASGGFGAPTLVANPALVPEGSQTILTWDLHGQTGCTLTGGLLSLFLTTNIGSVPVTVEANTTYSISCTSGGSASATAEIIPKGVET